MWRVSEGDRHNQQCFPMHNKTVYLKTMHSVLSLAHEAMRQAHSHLIGTFGELSKQTIAFSLQITVTIYTQLPLRKVIILVHQEGRKYLHGPQSHSVGFLRVSVALTIWQLVLKSR
jgi:hypothetical protein